MIQKKPRVMRLNLDKINLDNSSWWYSLCLADLVKVSAVTNYHKYEKWLVQARKIKNDLKLATTFVGVFNEISKEIQELQHECTFTRCRLTSLNSMNV